MSSAPAFSTSPLPCPREGQRAEGGALRGCSGWAEMVNLLSVCTQWDLFARAFCGFIKLNYNIGDSTAFPQSTHLASKENILRRKKGKKQVCGHLAQTHFISTLVLPKNSHCSHYMLIKEIRKRSLHKAWGFKNICLKEINKKYFSIIVYECLSRFLPTSQV